MRAVLWLPLLAVGGAWQASGPPAGPPKPLKHGPLAYYRDHCQRCHGAFGGAYEDNFTKGKSLSEMTDVIKSMAAGQGGSPLSDADELGAQIAFHYAIDVKKPFLSWTGLEGSKLTGEVTPDAKVSASLGSASLQVVLKDGVWSVVLPAGASASGVVVTATLGEAKSVLDLSKGSFSTIKSK